MPTKTKTHRHATEIRRVHLIFKTHLDLGFTDLAKNVESRYFQQYIPQALRVAQEMRESGGADRFVWTTGAWLIYEYLERGTAEERRTMEEAIQAGDIAWHALPFTTHSELMDPALFRFGLTLSHELDRRFGKQTIAAKMTDVPGHTRGIVPLLAEAGVRFLHIGVNPASTPPAVPPVFTWRAPDGSEVMVMYQKGAYGDLQIVPGLDEAIAFAHTNDNAGPQTTAQARAAFAHEREDFPEADVAGSTMDAFALQLARIKEQLPVVTEELGDTWIHGAATDPKKLSQFRRLLELRRRVLERGGAETEAAEFKRFSRGLLLVPEHTWGLDVKTHLADGEHFRKDTFEAARLEPNFQQMEASWREQRAYIDQAVATLEDSPLAEEALRALEPTQPTRPDTARMTRITEPLKLLETRDWEFKFDERGAIVELVEKASGRNWAAATQPLGLFCYQTFAQADYDRFYKQYIVHTPENAWWSVPDFTKPGLAESGAEARDWYPRLNALYQEAGGSRFLLELTPPEAAVAAYGCPAAIWLTVEFAEEEPSIRFLLDWFDKPASRLPEAIWFSFCPRVNAAKGWTMDKLGQAVSPLDVVKDGNRHLHGVGRGVHYRDGELVFEIDSRDAPLVAPGERALLDFNNRQPALKRGMHFLLYDNVWGTNFPMWYQDDAHFEFTFRRLVKD